MAKYEAGQMWVRGKDWVFVTHAEGKFLCVVESDTPYSVTEYLSDDARDVFAGYTLTNPRGLREAAENAHVTWRMATDSESAEVCKAMDALRAALEGGAE